MLIKLRLHDERQCQHKLLVDIQARAPILIEQCHLHNKSR